MSLKSLLTTIFCVFVFAFIPSASIAATPDEISSVLFSETSEALEIEIKDQDLIDTLIQDLEYAIEEDLIQSEIVEEIEESLNSETESDFEEVLDENLDEQELSWLEKSPELLNAFDLVKFEFHQCRILAVGGARECAAGLGFKLQAASIQIALDDLENQKATLDGLESAEFEAALADISIKEAELAQKLLRVEEKLSRANNGQEGFSDLMVAVTNLRDSGILSDNSSPVLNGNQGNGNQGNGNQGNGNQGNGNQGNGNQGNGNQGNGNGKP